GPSTRTAARVAMVVGPRGTPERSSIRRRARWLCWTRPTVVSAVCSAWRSATRSTGPEPSQHRFTLILIQIETIVAAMRTEICERLGIEFPIFAFSHCRDVVAAVSKAGGYGVLGILAFDPEQLE